MELTRRGAIRLAGVAGLAVASGAVLAVAPASVAQAAQSGWRWCQQCQGLWFAGNPSHGVCPVRGLTGHNSAGSGNYTLATAGDSFTGGQSGWFWCNRCQGLWYGLNGTQGACPAGFGHATAGSTSYSLNVNGGGQDDWRWCRLCQGLWFAGNGTSAKCPATISDGHDLAGSGNYHLNLS